MTRAVQGMLPLVVLLAIVATSCKKKDTCSPGARQDCSCTGGGKGTQTCASDGKAWCYVA